MFVPACGRERAIIGMRRARPGGHARVVSNKVAFND
jgi:hypothetical protein